MRDENQRTAYEGLITGIGTNDQKWILASSLDFSNICYSCNNFTKKDNTIKINVEIRKGKHQMLNRMREEMRQAKVIDDVSRVFKSEEYSTGQGV